MNKTNIPLDPSAEEFRKAAHEAVDWIAGFLQDVRDYPVLSQVRPGEVADSFPAAPSVAGRSYDDLLDDFREKFVPGITHWNHPRFFAYFSITGSQAGILGEMLSSALNVNGMLWRTSPAATELEERVLDWLRTLLGLPEGLFGIINDTASINTFLALAAAREALGLEIREKGMTGRQIPRLKIYCSDQAHSSVDKAALALGFGREGIVRVESDDGFRMKPDALQVAIDADLAEGAMPCAVVATTGTTSTAAIDSVEEIGPIAEQAGAWLHVDAAYGGSATILEEHRAIWNGVERADSIVVNPHKWLFTPIDCSVLYTKKPEVLKQTFSLVPEYLKTNEGDDVTNFMDYGLQLGRRIRALKLWFVLEHYGIDRLKTVIRQHCGFAERLAAELAKIDDVELIAPQALSVVVFRRVARDKNGAIDEELSDRRSEELLERINTSGTCFVSHTKLGGRYGIRVAIGNGATVWEDLEVLLRIVAEERE